MSADLYGAAFDLAADVQAAEALLHGIPVPQHRLQPEVLTALGLDKKGESIVLDAELARRVGLLRASPAGGAEPVSARVVCVADVQAERVGWLWPGRVPRGKLTVLDGDPGLGKSTLLLDAAARVSTGSPLPDGSVLDGAADVLILSAEDGVADTIRPRLEAAGADLARVHVLTAVRDDDGERAPELPADLALMERVIVERGVALVIVDPLLAFLAGQVDAHRDQDVRRALHALAAVAERTGAAIVAVRHLNKASGLRALYRGGGSIGIIAAARSGLLVAEDPQDADRRVLASIKSNLAKRPDALAFRLLPDPSRDVARVSWEGVVDVDADTLLGPRLGDDERTARAEAEDFLQEYLADGPRPAREGEAEAAGARIAKRTLERARATLGVKTEKTGFGGDGRWFWRLPGHGGLSSVEAEHGVLRADGLVEPNSSPENPVGEPKAASKDLGGLSAPLPGGEGFRAYVNGAHEAEHLTAGERLERLLVHDLLVRARAAAGESQVLAEADALVADGALVEQDPGE